MKTPVIDPQERMRQRNEGLRRVRDSYLVLVLCGQEDPYRQLMLDRQRCGIAGPKGSNLIAMVKISNRLPMARSHRRKANGVLFTNTILQAEIRRNHLAVDEEFLVFRDKNSFIIQADGTKVRLCWHHSPNHVGSISLIPCEVHAREKKRLHVNGQRGGHAMYTIPAQN
ncbi:MAG: hypothetical protein KKE83_02175 [Proteobacteria bacterium]|nr:hypothetical protein [Pseudomonadota bacterium]MBU1546429.1 hypothetical protein [Pseudomonadota bacterium]MBU2618472.1 hypothetical protein [Pseudomonadota bacterium]